MAKIRLDLLLQQKGLAPSREKARAIILAGEVQVDGRLIDKPGTAVPEDADLILESSSQRYVSRGGFKLEGAIRDFALDFQGKTVLDVGASTGGYTDCALQHGASRVYAVDVGYGQLDWTLRNDPRVVNMERTNIRYYKPEELGEQVDMVMVDVSFISTDKVFPVITHMLKDGGEAVILVKPQFEAGKAMVGKNGVVRDQAVHQRVLAHCIETADGQGLSCEDITFSPLKGPRGNIEFFLRLRKGGHGRDNLLDLINNVVSRAHVELGGR